MQTILDSVLWIGERFGYAIGVVFLALGVCWIVGVLRRLDDGFTWIGEMAPPPERTSPFARPSVARDENFPSAPGEVNA